MKIPTLYYQLEEGIPLDSFCSDAAIGARNSGIKAIGFDGNGDLPPYDPYNIIVGSVDKTQEYLNKQIPPIDREWSIPYEKRQVIVTTIDEIIDIEYPCFIKPAEEIKAWTGVVVDNEVEAKLFTMNYKGKVFRSRVMDIDSEYRVYVVKNRGIIGIKHYLGDPYMWLDEKVVSECYLASRVLTENAYSLDFGIDGDGNTFLIEINDGWALGNYGLSPDQYYSFVKNRFLQLTGVLK